VAGNLHSGARQVKIRRLEESSPQGLPKDEVFVDDDALRPERSDRRETTRRRAAIGVQSPRMVDPLAALYRVFYRGVLGRLPEPAAIALGQIALRLLPWDRLTLGRSSDRRLAVTLGGVVLPNPLILSSMYYDIAILRRAMGLGFGAVTTKSITRQPRPGHPPPNLVRVWTRAGPGLVNCNGFANPGVEVYESALARLRHRIPVIVAVAGESIEDYVALVERLGPFGDLVEFNISSPNTALVYEWSRKPDEVRRLFRAVRAATPKPLIVKLSPDFADANESAIIPAALDAGVSIVNYGNTRRVVEPRLSQGAGGLSGPELFPATLDNVRRTHDKFGTMLEIIATGGIDSPDKALACIRAGATACGYFTGFITRGPLLARQILDRLSHELDRAGTPRLDVLRSAGQR
jgi:dihydroorotate dehydrogenase